jgi:hypothetical protein
MLHPDKEIGLVYSPAGEPVAVTRLNALDLVRHSGYTWKREFVEAVEKTPEIVAEVIAEVLTEEAPAVEPAAEETRVDAHKDDLADVAKAIAGADAVTYLNGFSVEDLKVIAEERYGEKLRANVSKEKAIERIIALEAARIADESGPADAE